MGDQVGERDRDERVREQLAELLQSRGSCGRCACPQMPAQKSPATSAEREHEEDRVRHPQRRDRAEADVVGEEVSSSLIGSFRTPSAAPSKVVAADRHQDQRHRARHRHPARRRAQIRRSPEPAVADLERRQAREHPEVDRERLAALEPFLDSRTGPSRRTCRRCRRASRRRPCAGRARPSEIRSGRRRARARRTRPARRPRASGRAAPGR